MFFCETYIDHVARELGIRKEIVSFKNLYQEGDTTHFGQPMPNNLLTKIWNQVFFLDSLKNTHFSTHLTHLINNSCINKVNLKED